MSTGDINLLIVCFGLVWLGLPFHFGGSSEGGRRGGHCGLMAAVLYTYHCLCVYVQGKYDEAEHLSRRSLAIIERKGDAGYKAVTASIEKLANILRVQVIIRGS